MAASRSSCANRRRMFKPDSRASRTSLAPVACTVREVASRCSASKRNVILHDGISPFGVAIAPEYCTDAIFIFTDGNFFGGAAGGASFPICCDTLTIRSPSSCFVMYDPRLPLITLTITQQNPTTHPPESDDDLSVPRDCRDWKIRKSDSTESFACRCCARGWGGPGQPKAICRPNGQTHKMVEQRKQNSSDRRARVSFACARI